ncbi:MAG TPA: phytoene/squalene synthase family protein [Luteimonas sp.]
MSVDVDVREEATSFVAKWRARWPEWELGMVFVPAAQRPVVEAWFTLLQELVDAALGGGDPTPGLAKLAWWQEELVGWSKGARRHPLGAVLQPQGAPWQALGHALPDLRTLRGPGGDGAPHGGGAGSPGHAWAAAVAGCEAVLFGGRDDAAAATTVLDSLLSERDWMQALSSDGADGSAAAAGVAKHPGRITGRAGTRPRGIARAFVAARLRHPSKPLPPLRALLAAWRGARSSR